jgi:hypothetical protein
MTAFIRIPRLASTYKNVGMLALALLLAPGCKTRDGGSGGTAKNDPLLGGPGRIPKQNVPVPGGTASSPKGRGDPLLGSPTSGTRANAGGYSDDPDRWKNGPYVPGPGGSPAALAGKPKDDGEGLKIDTPGGVGLTPAAGSAPVRPPANDATASELAKYNVKRGDYSVTRESDQVVIRVKVSAGTEGPSRGFIGQGATEALAVKQVIDQIKTAK